jgi:hypothetical protein
MGNISPYRSHVRLIRALVDLSGGWQVLHGLVWMSQILVPELRYLLRWKVLHGEYQPI